MQESEDPLIQIGHLKLLYDLHKIEISEEDLTRVLASLYIKEQAAYRYFRERLFEAMAKKAIEQAEFVYKNRVAQPTPSANAS